MLLTMFGLNLTNVYSCIQIGIHTAFLILQKWSQQIPEDIRVEVQVYWRGGINDIYSVHSGFANICKKQLT